MNAALTYHSVGLSNNKYLSNLPSVDVNSFRDQLKILVNNYNLVDVEEFLDVKSKENILLTFDDGLKCHYDIVAPILHDMNIPAIFFISSGPTIYKEMLMVHQLQILISESKKNKSLFKDLLNFSVKHCESMDKLLQINPDLHIHQYESIEYNFIKKSFQIFIDKSIASDFLSSLLERYCQEDGNLFDHMYLNLDECKEMIDHGFNIGGHSRSHQWMQYLDKAKIQYELSADSELFKKLNIPKKYYCYPYGSFSEDCIEVVKNSGFEYGFTIESGEFNALDSNHFKIKRYDVNEFFNEII
tara:strand:+ start:576 stop:1475 length:900 start_codon:yes stop_codon:yes gene_type:complete